MELAGSPGPHVFVESLDHPIVDDDDHHHLSRALRMRAGDALTVSDGRGSWAPAEYADSGPLPLTAAPVHVPAPSASTTVAFSLVKGQKPELVVQKLTELGVDHLVVLDAERSVVRWDDKKVASHLDRFRRIMREASMQSHRVRLPTIDALVPAAEHLARPEVAAAHFGGSPITAEHRSIAIGPEGGWSPAEVAVVGARTVTLGATVLRAETAAIAAGTLLSATTVMGSSDPV